MHRSQAKRSKDSSRSSDGGVVFGPHANRQPRDTSCLRLFVVRGRAVRYDLGFDIMRCLMRTRVWRLCAVVGGFLAMPTAALADFGVDQLPQFAQNHAPDWLFQILSSILLAFATLLASLLGLGTAG